MFNFQQQLKQHQLREMYHTWLEQVVDFGRGPKAVAGSKTRKGFKTAQTWSTHWQQVLDAWTHTPERVWVWSDLHLGHENIIRFSNRPFDHLYRMHQVMLENCQHLSKDDVLIFGGDVSFISFEQTQSWLQQIPTTQLFLILGNHDVDRAHKLEHNVQMYKDVLDCLALPQTSRHPPIWMTHYPLNAPQIPQGTLNVHGHIHHHTLPKPHVNMCVEHTQYKPVRLMDLIGF